ncbi:MAG: sulfatase modifying factor 1, partial [Candidatus Paceibacteria bacterium]
EAEVELVDVDWGNHPSDASSLRDAAWDLVRPDRDSFGEEALGFALAERAVEGSDEAELAVVLQVLAWAHHALGEYEAALDVSHAALESGLEDKAEEALSNHEKLEKAVAAASSAEGLAAAKVEIAELKADSAELEARLNERQVWTFSAEEESETRARWWHNQITGLIGELRSLSAKGTGLLDADGVSEEHGWSVARRLAFAERLRVGYAEAGEFAQRWERDLPAIREAYPGLALPTQLGLVPIGPDPTSELWEFWDVHSGTEPLRDAAGELVFEESSGIVFVLLPAEKFWMGAQSVEPEGQNYDPAAEGTEGPVHEVELSAFFMSKYEMTQGQWMSLAGHNPSQYGPSIRFLDHQHDLTHPVESVSWFDCEALLPRFSLVLPSEAQWEYGARAGSDSVWWTGSTRESLRTQEAANLADQAAARAGATWAAIKDWPELDDGFAVHAPVTSFAANAFGLYNVHGNVWEWCLDGNDPSFYLNSPLLDPLSAVEGAAFRVTRGGGFNHAASSARSAVRSNDTPAIAGNILGLRPARVIVK